MEKEDPCGSRKGEKRVQNPRIVCHNASCIRCRPEDRQEKFRNSKNVSQCEDSEKLPCQKCGKKKSKEWINRLLESRKEVLGVRQEMEVDSSRQLKKLTTLKHSLNTTDKQKLSECLSFLQTICTKLEDKESGSEVSPSKDPNLASCCESLRQKLSSYKSKFEPTTSISCSRTENVNFDKSLGARISTPIHGICCAVRKKSDVLGQMTPDVKPKTCERPKCTCIRCHCAERRTLMKDFDNYITGTTTPSSKCSCRGSRKTDMTRVRIESMTLLQLREPGAKKLPQSPSIKAAEPAIPRKDGKPLDQTPIGKDEEGDLTTRIMYGELPGERSTGALKGADVTIQKTYEKDTGVVTSRAIKETDIRVPKGPELPDGAPTVAAKISDFPTQEKYVGGPGDAIVGAAKGSETTMKKKGPITVDKEPGGMAKGDEKREEYKKTAEYGAPIGEASPKKHEERSDVGPVGAGKKGDTTAPFKGETQDSGKTELSTEIAPSTQKKSEKIPDVDLEHVGKTTAATVVRKTEGPSQRSSPTPAEKGKIGEIVPDGGPGGAQKDADSTVVRKPEGPPQRSSPTAILKRADTESQKKGERGVERASTAGEEGAHIAIQPKGEKMKDAGVSRKQQAGSTKVGDAGNQRRGRRGGPVGSTASTRASDSSTQSKGSATVDRVSKAGVAVSKKKGGIGEKVKEEGYAATPPAAELKSSRKGERPTTTASTSAAPKRGTIQKKGERVGEGKQNGGKGGSKGPTTEKGDISRDSELARTTTTGIDSIAQGKDKTHLGGPRAGNKTQHRARTAQDSIVSDSIDRSVDDIAPGTQRGKRRLTRTGRSVQLRPAGASKDGPDHTSEKLIPATRSELGIQQKKVPKGTARRTSTKPSLSASTIQRAGTGGAQKKTLEEQRKLLQSSPSKSKLGRVSTEHKMCQTETDSCPCRCKRKEDQVKCTNSQLLALKKLLSNCEELLKDPKDNCRRSFYPTSHCCVHRCCPRTKADKDCNFDSIRKTIKDQTGLICSVKQINILRGLFKKYHESKVNSLDESTQNICWNSGYDYETNSDDDADAPSTSIAQCCRQKKRNKKCQRVLSADKFANQYMSPTCPIRCNQRSVYCSRLKDYIGEQEGPALSLRSIRPSSLSYPYSRYQLKIKHTKDVNRCGQIKKRKCRQKSGIVSSSTWRM